MDIVVLLLMLGSHLIAFVAGYNLRAYISRLHRSYR
jgi:hypothetical protein